MSDKAHLLKQLIEDFASDGELTDDEKYFIYQTANDIGISKSAADTLINIALANDQTTYFRDDIIEDDIEEEIINKTYKFKSAITRFGPLLTPHIIEINKYELVYKKRNDYLINVDTVSVPINKIASVKINTSLLGTDIIIDTYGSGTIIAKNFSKSDGVKIRQIINKIQNL